MFYVIHYVRRGGHVPPGGHVYRMTIYSLIIFAYSSPISDCWRRVLRCLVLSSDPGIWSCTPLCHGLLFPFQCIVAPLITNTGTCRRYPTSVKILIVPGKTVVTPQSNSQRNQSGDFQRQMFGLYLSCDLWVPYSGSSVEARFLWFGLLGTVFR